MFPNFYQFLDTLCLWLIKPIDRQNVSISTKSQPFSNSRPPGNNQKSNPDSLGNLFELIPGGCPGMHPARTDWDIKANLSWGSTWDHHIVAKIKGNRCSSCLTDQPTPTSSAAELIHNRAQPGNYLILGQVKINCTQYKIG